MKIRHSSLPKLALCGQYEGKQSSSDAASRGTMLDGVFRDAWVSGELPSDLNADDTAAVRWALAQCILLNGGADGLTTKESQCRIQTSGLEHMGTADGIAEKGQWLIDLKSGQVYDYTGQMAAYALGLMEMYFAQQWTTHLLFCDQQKMVTQHWTYMSAKETVQRILDNVGTAPVQNDYCNWCAKSLTCPARVASKDSALVTVAGLAPTVQDEAFLALLNDPERLGQFLAACQTLEDFRDAAKAKACELLEAGQKVPGWRLQKPRATEFVSADYVAKAVEEGLIGAGNAIAAYGSLSAKKAEQLWSVSGHEMPAHIVSRKVGKAPLVASK
jgi:hypothetical protein